MHACAATAAAAAAGKGKAAVPGPALAGYVDPSGYPSDDDSDLVLLEDLCIPPAGALACLSVAPADVHAKACLMCACLPHRERCAAPGRQARLPGRPCQPQDEPHDRACR